MDDSLISLPRALEMAGGISDATRRRIADFPRAIVLARTRSGHPCRIAFSERELRAWVASRIDAARDQDQVATDQQPSA